VPASAARIKRLQGVLGEFACHTVRISHDPADSSPRASRAAHALLLQSQPLTFAPCRPARQAEHNQQPWRRRWSASTYDDANGLLTARAWWLLGYFGHARVAALDGGLGAWVAAGRRLVEGEEALIDARDSERDRGEFESRWTPWQATAQPIAPAAESALECFRALHGWTRGRAGTGQGQGERPR
jgi:hypothetical protein